VFVFIHISSLVVSILIVVYVVASGKCPMASTSNIENGSSSCSEYRWEYEVFLSFGGDTRNNFTDHLYRALAFDKGIITFRDKEGVYRGKPISPELLNAIEKSKIAVVILSENYASSTWCLEELANILECVDAGRMRVLPIFYHVDPSDVRHLKGTFAAAFAKHVLAIFHHVHDERFKEKKVQKWRAALRRVADLSGHHLKDE
jgi:hypothetical protein